MLITGEAEAPVPVDASAAASLSGPAVALITTNGKRQNKGETRKKEMVACLAKGCDTLTPPHLRLCKKCFHECIAGKNPTVLLKSGDKAHYDPSTQRMVFPSGEAGPRKVVKAAVTFVAGTPGAAQ